MLYVREPGDLSGNPPNMLRRVGKGRPVAAILTCTLLRSLNIGVVPEKEPNNMM